MSSITSANTVLTIAIQSLFPVAQVIQQFSADDVTEVEALTTAETMMGVDGVLTGGFVNVPWVQTITLMGDSPSNDLFDQWHSAQQQIQDLYYATGLIKYPSIGRQYPLVKGILTSYRPVSPARRTLQPRAFSITWQAGVPTPI